VPERTPGLIGPHQESHEPSLLADNFINFWLDLDKPAPPKDALTGYREWDGSHGITDWGMDGNDRWGDCGAAATDHGDIAKAGDPSLLNTLGQPKYNGTLPTYWAYGLSMGEIGTDPNPPNQPDYGVANNTWLGFLWKNGLIDGYVEVPLEKLDLYASIGSGLLCGIQLDDQAQQQFKDHQPWDGPPNPQLGHDVWLIKTYATGGIAVVTWGAVQECTLDFRQNNVTDIWLITDNHDPRVDDAALTAALQTLHGVGT
jgi:hypothetical protein